MFTSLHFFFIALRQQKSLQYSFYSFCEKKSLLLINKIKKTAIEQFCDK
ncbi:hypothetical protein HMPREF3203_01426 [Proteus mirabilis]|nr:hypothetical protein HMPREF3203_01426 [Proteus mirabilis]